MGFFNNLKEKSKRLARTLHEQPESGGENCAAVSMEWDNIYVEIDNDANRAAANDCETKRRGPRTAVGQSDSQSTYDSAEETRNENYDEECGTPSVSNTRSRDFSQMPSKTMTSGVLTRAASFRSMNGGPAIDVAFPQENSQAEVFSITKDGKYLANNHFANAQLIRWKHAAEEGSAFVQILAFFSALGAILTTMYPFITNDNHWSVTFAICAFHTTTLCLLILIFEYRVCGARNPLSLRARIRSLLVRHLNILRLVWGRGFLYIFAGTMNVTIMYYPYCLITAGSLITAGILSIFMGAHAAFNLERLRLSLTDHSYLWNKFVKADSDEDNIIGIEDFSNLIWSLGLELDDAYTYRAFQEIDQDHDGVINFYEFKLWWIASQDDETIVTMETRRTLEMSKASMRTMDMSKASLAISSTLTIPNQINTGDRYKPALD